MMVWPAAMSLCRSAALVACTSGCVLASQGCYTEIRREPSLWEQLAGEQQTQSGSTARTAGSWSVRVARFNGSERFKKAYLTVQSLRQEAGLVDLWHQDDGEYTTVYHGRFRGPDWPEAKLALDRIQDARISGKRPYRNASLETVSLVRRSATKYHEHDLRQHAGLYSLQIGYYDEEFGDEFRKVAEEAVATLREDGEDAYFYHGPNRSIITIGLFGESDFDYRRGIRAYGPRMKTLQAKYPHHMGNGRELIEKRRGQVIGRQPSSIVQAR